MGSCLIVNPVRDGADEAIRAADTLDAFFDYVTGAVNHFPEHTIDEVGDAAMAMRVYNKRRYFNDSVRLWPTRKCIEKAYDHWRAGEQSQSLPGLMIKRNDEGELYYEF